MITHEIGTTTQLYCIIGSPVLHSLSPAIHNAAFDALSLNNKYMAFDVKKENLKDAIYGIKSLGIKGASVTVPHKIEVMSYLDEIDFEAKRIGSVNTILNKDNKLIGYNTDFLGVKDALLKKSELKGKKVCVIGAGGASYAVICAVLSETKNVTVVNRTAEKAKVIAKKFNIAWEHLSQISEIDYDILINTTSVGMFPKIDAMPIDEIARKKIVMDIIYNPLETLFLKEAKKRDCLIIDGLSMFIYQAARQFEIWTEKKAPIEIMKKVALSGLK